jgi:hypothetical protein
MGSGWWVTPEDEVVDVGSDEMHEQVAERLMIERGDQDKFGGDVTAQDAFLDMGAGRIRTYGKVFIVLTKKLTPDLLDTVTGLIAKHATPDFSVRVQETSSGRTLTFPVSDFLEFDKPAKVWRSEALAVASRSCRTAYVGTGWWISPNGEVIEVPPGKIHEDIAFETLFSIGEWRPGLQRKDAKDEYLRRGAVRVHYDSGSLFVEVERLTEDILDELVDLIKNKGLVSRSEIIILEEGATGKRKVLPLSSFVQYSKPAKLWKAVAFQSIQCSEASSTTSQQAFTMEGWWILPGGEVVEVPFDKSHEEVAAEILSAEDEQFDDTADAFNALMRKGAVRLKSFHGPAGPMFHVMVRRLTSEAMDAATDILIENAVSGMGVRIDETSTRRVLTFPIDDFLGFKRPADVWRSEALAIANVTMNGVEAAVRTEGSFMGQAWWITPDGDLVEIQTPHEIAAQELLEKQGEEFIIPLEAYETFLKRGAIRLRNHGGVFYINVQKLTPEALDAATDVLIKQSSSIKKVRVEEEGSRRVLTFPIDDFLDFKRPADVWRADALAVASHCYFLR